MGNKENPPLDKFYRSLANGEIIEKGDYLWMEHWERADGLIGQPADGGLLVLRPEKQLIQPNIKQLAKCIVEEKQINKGLNKLLKDAYDTLWQWRNNLSVSVDQVDNLIKVMQTHKKRLETKVGRVIP